MTVALLPSRTCDTAPAEVGLDLTGLGADPGERSRGADLPVDRADLARLAAYTRAADEGGVSFVALDEGFRLRSDRGVRPDAWLDPVVAARRISPSARSGGLVPSVRGRRADAPAIAGELARMERPAGTWTGLQVTGGALGGDAVDVVEDVARSLARRTSRPVPRPRVVVPLRSEADLEAAGAVADVVRVRESDISWARELRYALRASARAARREVRVLVDLHVVVSVDRAAAEARADLLADIAGPHPAWEGALQTVGVADDVVATVERWVTSGAADGFVVLPGSVPADVAALLRVILPALRARGLVADPPAGAGRPQPARRPAGSRPEQTARTSVHGARTA